MEFSEVEAFIELFEAQSLPGGNAGRIAFAESLRALLASPVAVRDWPFTYYSRQRLLSVAARREWVAPDLREEIP